MNKDRTMSSSAMALEWDKQGNNNNNNNNNNHSLYIYVLVPMNLLQTPKLHSRVLHIANTQWLWSYNAADLANQHLYCVEILSRESLQSKFTCKAKYN
jgi:hypothetical protein